MDRMFLFAYKDLPSHSIFYSQYLLPINDDVKLISVSLHSKLYNTVILCRISRYIHGLLHRLDFESLINKQASRIRKDIVSLVKQNRNSDVTKKLQQFNCNNKSGTSMKKIKNTKKIKHVKFVNGKDGERFAEQENRQMDCGERINNIEGITQRDSLRSTPPGIHIAPPINYNLNYLSRNLTPRLILMAQQSRIPISCSTGFKRKFTSLEIEIECNMNGFKDINQVCQVIGNVLKTYNSQLDYSTFYSDLKLIFGTTEAVQFVPAERGLCRDLIQREDLKYIDARMCY